MIETVNVITLFKWFFFLRRPFDLNMSFLFKNRFDSIHKTYLVKCIILIITKMIYTILSIGLNFVIFYISRLSSEQIIFK